MLLLTHIFTFILVVFILLLNIRSLMNEENFEFISDLPLFNDYESSFFSPYSRIHLKQQLKSRLPNINEPLRNLKIGKLNFLHTTDTHGWYLGHLNQRQYSSDWGDFISFHSNLLLNLNNQGSDLLLVDSGDRHDGNGLSDLTSINGELSSKIFMMLDYDLITVGNHELYNEDISKFEYETLVPKYGDHFISTNVQYKNDDNQWVIFGNNTHRYFETKINNYKILSFSFLFDFKMGNQRVNVIPINTIINQSWFIDLVDDYSKNYEIDTIVIFGHLPVANEWSELKILHDFLRSYFPTIYIQYLGGHSHIRDFAIYDNLSTGLQSGRYCETAGFLSIDELPNNLSQTKEDYVTNNIHRRYIDFNLHSFMHHTNHTILDKFNTENGLFVSKELSKYSKDLELDEVYGNVPHTYYISAANYNNKDEKSLLRFLEDEVLIQLKPKSCNVDNKIIEGSKDNDRVILINTGGIRYDLYKGEFNKNSLFTVSPFKNMWRILPSVPTNIALKIQNILNKGDFIINNQKLKSSYQIAFDNKYLLPQQSNSELMNTNNNDINDDPNDNAVFTVSNFNLYKQHDSKTTIIDHNSSEEEENDEDNRLPLSYGYTTIDEYGIYGDDTIHKKLRFFYVPNVIQSHEFSSNNSEISSEFTDVVYYDFIEPFVLNALKEACNGDDELFENLTSNSSYYNDCPKEDNLGQLLKKYAISNWN